MPITNIPFDSNLKGTYRSKFDGLFDYGCGGGSDDEQGERELRHAAFLKDLTRTAGPTGYIDADSYQNHYKVKARTERAKTGPKTDASRRSLVRATNSADNEKTDFEKHLRLIENALVHAKQEKRDQKRDEGDILKTKQVLRGKMRYLENDLTTKKMEENRRLAASLAKYDDMQKSFNKKKQKDWHERYLEDKDVIREYFQADSSLQNKKNSLLNEFLQKGKELELVRNDINRFVSEFEAKMKAKEEEEFKLKKQLTDLAITINMEAHKQRTVTITQEKKTKTTEKSRIEVDLKEATDLENGMAKGAKECRQSLAEIGQMEKKATSDGDRLKFKQLTATTKLQSVRENLKQNYNKQSNLDNDAMMVNLDKAADEQDKEIKKHNQRRIELLDKKMSEKKERETAQEEMYYARAQNKLLADKLSSQEDNVKLFQKYVTVNEDEERKLFQTVKQSDISCQTVEQEVRRLQHQLMSTQSSNAEKLRRELHQANVEEEAIKQKLIRKQAVLDKTQAERSDTYQKLLKKAEMSREEKTLYEKHKQELQHTLRFQNPRATASGDAAASTQS